MNEQDALVYFEAISTFLLQSNLSWIREQVQEEIDKGRITTKAPKDIQLKNSAADIFKELKTLPSKDKFAISEPYSRREQLEILLNAFEEALKVVTIKKEIFSSIKEFQPSVQSIVFISENSAASDQTVSIENLSSDDDTISRLQTLIAEIKKEI